MKGRVKVKVKKLHPQAKIPQYHSELASGVDLCTSEKVIIQPNEYALVPTGIAIEIPRGFEGQVRPRSGLALTHGIGILNSPGTIDADYRGEIKVLMFNFGKENFEIKPGTRIAQLVIARFYQAQIIEGELTPSSRGSGGFGSTGT